MPKLYDPAKYVRPPTYKAALKVVNELRVGAGKKPLSRLPKGQAASTCECPIAKALKPIGVQAVDAGLLEFAPRTLTIAGLKFSVEPALTGTSLKRRRILKALDTFIADFDESVAVTQRIAH